jgi:hypothetical protein
MYPQQVVTSTLSNVMTCKPQSSLMSKEPIVMSKRANGEGNVYQRANGTWEARMTFVDPATGRRRRVSFYAKTAKAVRAEMRKARDRVEAGAPVKDASTSVENWLSHWCATTLAASDRKESTRALYNTLSRQHLEPAPFGATPLDKLRRRTSKR